MTNRPNLEDTWNRVIEFNNKFFPNWKETEEVYYSNALAGEVGEVCNITKHRSNGGTKQKEISDFELMEELADVFIYLELIIEKHGINYTAFSDIVNLKISKNIIRMADRIKKYNNGKWE